MFRSADRDVTHGPVPESNIREREREREKDVTHGPVTETNIMIAGGHQQPRSSLLPAPPTSPSTRMRQCNPISIRMHRGRGRGGGRRTVQRRTVQARAPPGIKSLRPTPCLCLRRRGQLGHWRLSVC